MSEREFCPFVAQSKIEKIIRSLDLEAITRYTDNHKLVAVAELFDKSNAAVEAGAGKGPNSLVGALAESVEHYCALQLSPAESSIQQCAFISNQHAASHDGFLTNLRFKNEAIDCFKLTTLDRTEDLFIPSVLLRPKLHDQPRSEAGEAHLFLSRYSSNSGSAFGCTQAEALLHGANELIERHVLSKLFLAICSLGPSITLYRPSSALLARSLQNAPHALGLAEKLQIIVVCSSMNSYFSIALPKSGPGDFHLSPIGSGNSLDIQIAIQRAVTEQIQASALYDAPQEKIDRKTFAFLANSKSLRHLIDFEPIRALKLPPIDEPPAHLTPSVPLQLKTLNNNITDSGRKLYYRVITDFPGNGIVCQSYIPGLERFNIIRNGCLVAPQTILRQLPAK